MKKFVAIDTLSIAYKSYFAFINRPLINSKGENTSAVYGFLNQFLRILETIKPDYIISAFDSKEKTFRHSIYPNYKSSREEMPEDLVPQISIIRKLVELFGIPAVIKPEFEADDIIGALSKKFASENLLFYAVTPDKDYIQLLNDNVQIVLPNKTAEELEFIDFNKAFQKYGFSPQFMVDYLALIGDKSDDIPGVKGIGEKTAVPLINEFGSLENIYQNLNLITKSAVKLKLENDKENAFLSKKLATILTNIELDVTLDNAKLNKIDYNGISKLLNDLEIKRFENRINAIFKDTDENKIDLNLFEDLNAYNNQKVRYNLLTNENEIKELASKLANCEMFVFDTETDSLDQLNANLAGVAFAIQENEAYYIPINPFNRENNEFTLPKSLHIDKFKELFGEVFKNESIKKVCQNGKYDLAVLRNFGIEVNGFFFDTMIASYLIDSDKKHGLDELAQLYLNYKTIKYSDVFDQKDSAKSVFTSNLNEISIYACEDADITFKLYNVLKTELKRMDLEYVAYNVEFPLVPVLEIIERNGIKVDHHILQELSKEMEYEIDKITDSIYSLTGEIFNINSTKQLQELLFEKLNLPKTKKTKTGYSTDFNSLETLIGKHPVIEKIQYFRQISKLKSTYTDSLQKIINKNSGRIHTSFLQSVASTGRLSSINPNLQNIPIRTEIGKEIRKAFIPTNENYLILSADYSQIELRIMASICNDPGLVEAFNNNQDIHRATASQVFSVKPEDVDSDMRRKAKEVNFGILYGIGAFGLKTRLGITQSHAQNIIDTYFAKFSKVKEFMDMSIEKAREKGYAETLCGRKRYLRNINSSNRMVRQFEERVAINMPIQGTAADMIKLAMISIQKELSKLNSKTLMVLQVHDELVFDIPKNELNSIKFMIKEKMENSLKLNVPIKVEIEVGENWLEAH